MGVVSVFTDRDHHQSWVGAVIALGWLYCGVAALALAALVSYAYTFGLESITWIFQ